MADEQITVEVAYALAHKQKIIPVKVAAGTSARDVVSQSGIARDFPEVDVETADLGLFGKAIKDDYQPEPGERLEIYRPLKADPKDARKARAAKAKEKKAGA